jgi:hypothetical protein
LRIPERGPAPARICPDAAAQRLLDHIPQTTLEADRREGVLDHRLRVGFVVVLALVLLALLLVPAADLRLGGAAQTGGSAPTASVFPATGRPTLYDFTTDS